MENNRKQYEKQNNRNRIKYTVDTKILLTLITIAAILYGDGGIAALLWIGYGIYKLFQDE